MYLVTQKPKMFFSFVSCLWLQILADVQAQKWTNSRRAKLRDHISVLCTFLHHVGAQMSSQEHPLGQ